MSNKDKYGNKIEHYTLPRELFNSECVQSGCNKQNYDDGYAALYSNGRKALVYIEGDVVCITGNYSGVSAAVEERTKLFKELL